MPKNKTLSDAKSAKNDEFYTQYADIQKEVNAYLDYNPDTFRGKTILLPCDDPEWSKFTRFFAENFERLGLKKLISTSYAAASKKFKAPYQPSLFESESPQFDAAKTEVRGKIFVLTDSLAKYLGIHNNSHRRTILFFVQGLRLMLKGSSYLHTTEKFTETGIL